jgi:hypothetical protein
MISNIIPNTTVLACWHGEISLLSLQKSEASGGGKVVREGFWRLLFQRKGAAEPHAARKFECLRAQLNDLGEII